MTNPAHPAMNVRLQRVRRMLLWVAAALAATLLFVVVCACQIRALMWHSEHGSRAEFGGVSFHVPALSTACTTCAAPAIRRKSGAFTALVPEYLIRVDVERSATLGPGEVTRAYVNASRDRVIASKTVASQNGTYECYDLEPDPEVRDFQPASWDDESVCISARGGPALVYTGPASAVSDFYSIVQSAERR